MMKIVHLQTNEEAEISRYEWETKDAFFKSTRKVIDQGDPVILYQIDKNTKAHSIFCKIDRDHAVRMIKMHPDMYYFKEVSEEELPLDSLSPAIKNAAQSDQPKQRPIKKSDHSIWDKIKYISGIVGAIGVVIGAIGKLFNLW